MPNNLWNPEQLTGVQDENSNYIGKRFAYARKKSEKGIPFLFLFNVLREIGLEHYTPNQPVATDAFRRACQSISKGYIKEQIGDRRFKINMVMIDESADPILRNIQLTEIDKEEKITSEGKLVARIEFNRESGNFESFYGYEAGYAYDGCPDFVIERIEMAKENYIKECTLISDMQLHSIIQKILIDAGNPVNGISSTWNIPKTREDILEKLLLLAERLEEFEENIFIVDTLPVVKTEETVAKIKSDAITFALNQFNSALENAKDRVANAKDTSLVSERSFEEVRQEGEKIMSLIEEYETLLGEAFDEVRQAKELTENRLREFVCSPEQQAEHISKKRKIRTEKTKNPPSNTRTTPKKELIQRKLRVDMLQPELDSPA